MNSKDIQKILDKRTMFLDGGFGTMIQKYDLTKQDFDGFAGCNDYLSISKPEIIQSIHEKYLIAGSDIIETNTFGANKISLAEYGLEDKTFELAKKSTELAKKAAQKYSTDIKPRFVASCFGPGTKLVSLEQISFEEVVEAYLPSIQGAIEGGADLLLIETVQDILHAKAIYQSVLESFKKYKTSLPIMLSVTMEESGKMLLGTEMKSVIAAFSKLDIFSLGLNCGTGPDGMEENIKTLSKYSELPISIHANAGLPEMINGKAVYNQPPDKFSQIIHDLVRKYTINVVGGCCGTSPDHIRALADRLQDFVPQKRRSQNIAMFSSLYAAQEIDVEPKPLIVGERTNANGSKEFKEFLKKDDFDGMLQVAKLQKKEGSHAIDVSVAYAGRNEVDDMQRILKMINKDVDIPVVIDSTNLEVIEKGLQCLAGRSIINSISLEDSGVTAKKILGIAKKHGAGIVGLCIDEKGMAKTLDRKVEIAKKLHDLVVSEFGYDEGSFFIDPLTFSIGSGEIGFQSAALETINAIKEIKKIFPKVNTILGVSNVSHGLGKDSRKVLNSVFLYLAVKSGLDAAIIRAGKIMPVAKIPTDLFDLAERLIWNKKSGDESLIKEYINYFTSTNKILDNKSDAKDKPIEIQLQNLIIDGNKKDLERILDKMLEKYSALDIINDHLLKAMKLVGESFRKGTMPLPFVLESAEVMKQAVSILEPKLGKENIKQKGSILIATVKGDIHDIGKNLVDIILSNNNYQVVNIGVDRSVDQIVKALSENKIDCLGLSGLLVKSIEEMKNVLQSLKGKGYELPVICGGAALTKDYVEKDLQNVYRGKVYYAKDAIKALEIMEQIKNE